MQVSTASTAFSALSSATGSDDQSLAVSLAVAAAASQGSAFGPDSVVTVGGGFTVAGFTDYTNLGTNGVYQFDLSGILSTQGAAGGVPAQARSEEQQKQDAKMLEAINGLIDSGSLVEARNLANDMLDENPTNASAVAALGRVAVEEGDYKKGEQLYTKAHAIDGTVGYDNDAQNARTLQGDDTAVLRQAQAYIRAGGSQREEGVRLLISLTERAGDFTAAHVTLADALLKSGDGNNALMEYNTAVRVAKPEELGGLENRLQQLVDEAPSSAFARQLLGKAQLKQGHNEVALQTLTAAAGLADDPTPYNVDVARAHLAVGHDRLDHGDLSGALLAFERAKELAPTNNDVKFAIAEGYVKRAEQRSQRGDLKSALDDYQAASSLLPEVGQRDVRERAAHGAYGVALRLQRQRIANGDEIDAEVRGFQVAYDLVSDEKKYRSALAEVRVALGDQYLADGDEKSAAYAYKRAYDLYPHNDTYRDKAVSAFIQWGNERLYSLNYNDAVDAFREAFELNPNDTAAKTQLATAYNARGLDHKSYQRYKQAVKDFKEALKLFPDNATYQSNYNSVSPWDTDDD